MFERFRRNMYRRILQETGYDLMAVKEKEVSKWLLEVLLGNGVSRREARQGIGKAVAAFVAVAMRKRARILQAEKS